MSRQVEFYFDFGSPNAYLAHTQMPGLAERTGAEVVYRPMLLGGVFKATDNTSPAFNPAKGRYLMIDLPRSARRYGVPYEHNPHFPINTLALMRGAIAYRDEADFMAYCDAVYRAMWVEQRNMGEPEVVAEVLGGIGIGAEDFIARISDGEVKQGLIAATEEAVSRGIFGAPSFLVGDELFFGQDRIDHVADALARGRSNRRDTK